MPLLAPGIPKCTWIYSFVLSGQAPPYGLKKHTCHAAQEAAFVRCKQEAVPIRLYVHEPSAFKDIADRDRGPVTADGEITQRK